MTASIASSARPLISSAAASASGCADLVDRGGGGHHQRIAVVGAEVGHPPVDHDLHHLALAAERSQRQAAADALGERDQVRLDTEPLRGARVTGGETGLHLVEDQHHAVLVTQGADAGQVALVGEHDREVLDHRLDHHRGDIATVLGQDSLEHGQVVVRHDVHRARLHVEGDVAHRSVGGADVGQRGLHRHLQRVVPAVIAALDLHDRLALGVRPGGADGVHQRLGARVREAQHVQPEACAEAFAHVGRLRARCDEQRADLLQRPADVLDDHRVEVADQHRAEAHRQIEQAPTVDIGEPGALGGLDRDRVRVPVLERRGDPEWQGPTGAHVVLTRTRSGLREPLPLRRRQCRRPVVIDGAEARRQVPARRRVVRRPDRGVGVGRCHLLPPGERCGSESVGSELVRTGVRYVRPQHCRSHNSEVPLCFNGHYDPTGVRRVCGGDVRTR